jgi:hypothetical protein
MEFCAAIFEMRWHLAEIQMMDTICWLENFVKEYHLEIQEKGEEVVGKKELRGHS